MDWMVFVGNLNTGNPDITKLGLTQDVNGLLAFGSLRCLLSSGLQFGIQKCHISYLYETVQFD